jgi:hypothetical protein
MQYAVSATLGDGIGLLGYDLSPATVRPGQNLTLTLYWRALTPGGAWLRVFTHLIGSDGALIGQHDGPPAEGTAPTSEWLAQEVITDQHIIPIPADAPDGGHTLYVGMYSPDTGERLLALDAGGMPYSHNAIPLRPISIILVGEDVP